MKRMIISTSLIALFTMMVVGDVLAKATEIAIDEIRANNRHRQVTLLITQVIEKRHYVKPTVNDALSNEMFDRYLESLDGNKSFLSAQDIAAFDKYRFVLDDALRTGRIDPAFEIFRRFRGLLEQRIGYALSLLKRNQFNFEIDEDYRFDRIDADWMSDQSALDDMWRRRLKNDILLLRLADKDDEKITELLRKRYEGVRRRIRQMTADDVFQAFVNSFTLTIEPHTSYMSPQASENFDITMRLSLQGIGAVLRTKNEHTVIQSIVAGGPAANSKAIHAGDRILGVAQGEDGEMEEVVGWRLQDVVEQIRGPKDSIVRLNVLPKREGLNGRTHEIVIVRDEIKLEDKAAKSEIIEGKGKHKDKRIGVIDLPGFYRDFGAAAAGEKDFRSTTRDVRRLLQELQEKQVDGIIVDLRRNGGGSLTEATELTGLFIEKGPVVQVRYFTGEIDVEKDKDESLVYDGPLAVLVDRNSASASEIFAGAIQDYQRGLVIGEPTYGKGTVQTLYELNQFMRNRDDIGRLRLTMAQFFRVEGGSTQHKGVMPDVVFPTAKGAAKHGERALENAIPWASVNPLLHAQSGISSVPSLRDANKKRVANDPGFAFLVEQENEILEMEETDTVTLNFAKRKAEWQATEDKRLARLNRLRAYRGLEPLTAYSNDDDEDSDVADEEDPEGIQRIMLDETANILADYISDRLPTTTAQIR